jgi:tripartite-type tricarboxylate transporter receptor subunit TctC
MSAWFMRIAACVVPLWLLITTPATAQEFPTRPVHLVVPFPPGGAIDLSGRLIAQHLSERWRQPIIVDNKPGGTTGPEFVARSAGDGYTLLIISSSPLVTLPQMQKVNYDVMRDLVGVTQTTLLTYALIAAPGSGFSSVGDLIDYAKRNPGKLNYSSAGNGSGQHLYMELFKTAAGIELTHVPYKGSAQALSAVMSGEVQAMIEVSVSAAPLVQSGKARGLMVTGGRPLPQYPGAVPFDSLYPGVGISSWHGIIASRATPQPILDRIARDLREVLALPAVGDRFRQLGVEPSGVSGAEFDAIVQRDYERWGQIIRRNKLRAD